MIKRTIAPKIKADLEEKVVLISGPRQVGKTTLAKSISNDFDYFNYDSAQDRIALGKQSWDRKKSLVIFDELHKMRGWKRWLKGVFDTQGIRPRLLVTGSSRLDIAKKMGDSLAGRYFQHRLHPLDLKELKNTSESVEKTYNRLINYSGFPEPFIKNSTEFYQRWQKSHTDIILRQDLIELESARSIQSIETLLALLQTRVGATVSYSSLARDLERDPKTVKRWLVNLENLYTFFSLVPYSRNIARSLLKEPKYYFFDLGRIVGGEGEKLENLVALSLKKELDWLQDSKGISSKFNFLRTKEKKEIDFFIEIGGKDSYLIEVKLSDENPSPAFSAFSKFFPKARKIQLVKNLRREKTFPDGVEVRSALDWIRNLSLAGQES